MIKNITIIILLASLASCGSGGESSEDGSKLTLIQQSASISSPAIVSISFKVETEKGNPVVGLTLKNNLTVLENDEPISLLEAQPKLTPDHNEFVYSTLLLLDLSGSILGSSFESLKSASKVLIEQIIPNNNPGNLKMKIAFFDGNQNITTITSYLSDQKMLKDAIDGLTENISNDSSTNLNGAVVQGVNEIENAIRSNKRTDVLSAGSLILFTDGKDRAGRTTEDSALKKVESADTNLSIFTIGLSGEIDKAVLAKFGRNGFKEATGTEELINTFQDIASLTNDQSNSYYIFKYCSPRRSRFNNEIKITAEKDNKKGELIYSFSAFTFTGGCLL